MKPGDLLIAEPSIFGDLNFHRSVVVLVDYKTEGYIGFIINKVLPYPIKDIVSEIKVVLPLFSGGPVEEDSLFFIHNVGHLIPESEKISENLFWGGNIEKAIALVNSKIISEKEIRFFLGYSGWSKNQLEQEIETESWVVIKNKYASKILEVNPNYFWKNQMVALGGKRLVWANSPENPHQN
ncbi:MAG: YqgE/AlgH family protein [Flavobacteriales bacterium]|jgi:putative transcriptional regulator|tara:strand:- start:881 stop:1426 length:546 start_codon:yes stop_codon:yes gene_type:complete